MNAIATPAQGLHVYNTTLLSPCWFNGTSWDCGNANTCGTVVIYGGTTYNTVQIGQQCWMRENLVIGTTLLTTQAQTNNGIIEKYCYNNDAARCTTYGGLYNWTEMMSYATPSYSNPSNRRGICPAGWHIPSYLEFDQLATYLGGASAAGAKMKETGTAHWQSPNPATNSSGFTGLPGGYVSLPSSSINIGTNGYFWTTSDEPDGGRVYYYLNYNSFYLSSNYGAYNESASVRCLRD
jgi:uncharacterized protein (TIGR02145 family)